MAQVAQVAAGAVRADHKRRENTMVKSIRIEKQLACQQGFTLIEVLMAMVVGTIGLLAIALMQGYAIEGNSSGNRFTQATFVAQDMLENIKDGNNNTVFGDANDIAPGWTAGDVLADSGGTENVDENGVVDADGPFGRSWQIQASTQWSRLISVTVTWADAAGRVDGGGGTLVPVTRSLTLTSVSRGGGN